MSAMRLNGNNNKVYRESELIDGKTSLNDYAEWFQTNANYLNIIYPNVQTSSSNYDFITSGFNNGISFIGLNFQTNDSYLTLLNTEDNKSYNPTQINGFGGYAFKPKPEKVAANDTTNALIKQFKENIDAGNTIINDMVKDNTVYS
jgi:hypothetical protein